uniref:Dioxygenase n=1 Tax=Aureoumbra lagunensis TaxID=44058 RepID=A0A7S3NHN6_9STRA|eukprot:CAMPEP_0197309432 /NCGR_PEP_ID=MMETSP0891-20130614/8005_1 /TAXON_ID=44058 ORGANISM="Aureoumbra lagunensis, Strain CCMP1510" /NCGR_SAMPLE_ID=MMETSP0891 /ASSEMBLY_ACC=CAM_ASM_000534 /LENGTH=547 /DNA_ID=CAMNT_0042794489 /DNA_START=30 /DNA_END=1673 /DNA_ORIENTATION=-
MFIFILLVSGFSSGLINPQSQKHSQRLQRHYVIEEDSAKVAWETVALSAAEICPEEIEVGRNAPKGLRGTWYVNGLSSCQIGNRLVHPFEAHGFIKAFRFDGEGKVTMRSRFVETDVQRYEAIAKRPLYRGAMSNVANFEKFPDFLLNAVSPSTRAVAQLAVRCWGKDQLFASTDNAPWFRLDPVTLETIGEESMNNHLLRGTKMLAHTRIDHDRNVMCAAAAEFDAFENTTKLILFEFDVKGNQLSRIELTEPFFIFHDFAITQDFWIIPINPGKFDLDKLPNFIFGRAPATDIFQLDFNRNLCLLLVPRGERKNFIGKDAADQAIRIDLGCFGATFHVGPHWIDSHGRLIAHAFIFERYIFGGEMGFDIRKQQFNPTPWSLSNGGPKLHRIIIDNVRSVPKLTEFIKLSEIPTDMPTMHPDRDGYKSRYVYGTAGIRDIGWFPFNSLVKFDLDTDQVDIWRPSDPQVRHYCVTSEPYFLPRLQQSDSNDDDDDGWLLSLLHDVANNVTELQIFDAKHLSTGPIWSTSIGKLWPWNVHTTFDPKLY